MLSDVKTNRQVVSDLKDLLRQIDLRLQAFEIAEKLDNPEIKEILQDMIVYDLSAIMDDKHAIFPFQ
jgi:DnaJ-domain-containing protein 1